MVDGLVIVDKEPGWTSHDVVAKLRSVYGQKRVGHAGTLDPDATGVLLVGLGRVTRLMRFLQAEKKVYRSTIQFGVVTNTLDAAGEVTGEVAMTFTRSDLEAALPQFVGDIKQIPPMVSAVKIDGKRLYASARAGEVVARPPRPVTVHKFLLEDFDDAKPGFPRATVLVECSSGTYIRSLAADLGEALGGLGHIATLRRISSGSFGVEEAHAIDSVIEAPSDCLLSPLVAMRDLDQVEVDLATEKLVSHGRRIPINQEDKDVSGPCAVVGARGELLAVYEPKENEFVAAVVVSPGAGE